MLEKNRHSLKKALEQLPRYAPEAVQWERLRRQLDGQAVASRPLPQHEAPAHIWDRLEGELEYQLVEKNRSLLRLRLRQLPLYQAPAALWSRIEAQLPALPGPSRGQWLQAAASVVLLCLVFAGFLWLKAQYPPRPPQAAEGAMPQELHLETGELIYSEETISKLLEWETSPPSFAADSLDSQSVLRPSNPGPGISSYLQQDVLWQNDPELLRLQRELQQLDQALQQLRAAFPFEDEPDWVQHIARIERQRAQLIQKIIQRY
ncbi:MAG: hypothetical protein D6730_06565 [Bacteroidetes bacterium]|nr:MAG: hypothetical protein D6730_06565 [Bacteroidota bacterium]